MEQGRIYITSAVVLRNGVMVKDGSVIFRAPEKGAAFLQAAYEHLGIDYPRFYKMDLLSKAGTVAVDMLLRVHLGAWAYRPEETGMVLSNRNASIDADVQYLEASKAYPSPALFVYTLPNIVIGEISIRYKFKGENAFFISETFDADWIHWYVTDLVQRGLLKACICGWIDVMNEQPDGCLFLVEQAPAATGQLFTAENLWDIYNKDYEM
ncbi:hypothetical protein [Niabella drilacis]|uniref:Beta-ketoacyl synthase, N-terminal domain n=1 Tax=Niabella drilacis (strain DSM 25811 / CCM 8410 / CCUG 62505 / LMG 26954 / E90) TaxID=1285928 RepID=A0A1G6Q6P3_NIADE|nr:hypothetical protein [Niabella drilacis]SDC88013.1 hypothetical protein SAMN04487894_104299 [Niabella drilacis]